MRFICTALTLCYLSGLHGAALAPWVSPNVRLGVDPAALPSGDGKNQAEPHVTRSFVDPDLVLATFQEGRYSDGGAVCNGYAVSRDGGFTWHRDLNPNLTLASGGIYYRATDPVAGISLDGTLYLNSLVALDAAFNVGRLVVQRSDDHGQTWSNPITIYTGPVLSESNWIFPDKNWMVVNDLPGSPNEGRIIVTWTNFRTQVGPGLNLQDVLIMCAHSDDAGNTWSTPVFVTPAGGETQSDLQYQGSQPVFLPGGGLAIVYHNFSNTALEVRYSPDGGASFPFGPAPLHDGYILYDAANMRDGSFLPSVGVARESGDLFVAYTSKANDGDQFGEIYFVRSERVTADSPANTAPEWNFRDPIIISGGPSAHITCTPTLSVSPDGQRVTVFFYDNRNGAGTNDSGDFHAVQSLDGGTSWSEAFRISESTFPLDRATLTNRGYMLGDYYGFAPPLGPDQAGIAVWVGTPFSTADPWSSRIGGLENGVFEGWLQAQLPFSQRYADPLANRYADPDRDGIPTLLEYVTGLSPNQSDLPGPFSDGFSFHRLAAGTDPDMRIQVRAGTGQWPDSQVISDAVPFVEAHGEGYWDTLTWVTAGAFGHFEFILNEEERWFFVDQRAPARWVMVEDNSWVWSPWLGGFNTRLAPWLFHESLGWVYDLDGVFWSPLLSAYLLPSPSFHPWMYRSDGSYIYLLEGEPRLFDTVTEEWIRSY